MVGSILIHHQFEYNFGIGDRMRKRNYRIVIQDYSDGMNMINGISKYIKTFFHQNSYSSLKDTSVVDFYKLFPDYIEENHEYKKGDPFTYNGKYYRASQDILTSSQWKPGDPGTESLFYEIKIASNGIIIWQQPRGEFDAPDKGDLRWYPDENGFIYESLIDDNAFSPEAYPSGWKQL